MGVFDFLGNKPKKLYSKKYLEYNLSAEKVDAIDRWVQNNIFTKRERYLGLCLFSERRCTGKSFFSINSIYPKDHVLVFRSYLRSFRPKIQPSLCVIDDLTFSDLENNISIYKQIVTGQPTTMYVKYANDDWNYNIPCIITTNEPRVVSRFLNDRMFNESVQVIQIGDNETLTDPKLILSHRQYFNNILDKKY